MKVSNWICIFAKKNIVENRCLSRERYLKMFFDPITYTYLVIFSHDKYYWTLNISFLDIKTMLWHFEKWVWLATFCGRIKICQCFVLPHCQLQVTSWVGMKIFQLCGHNKKYFQIAKWGNGAKIFKIDLQTLDLYKYTCDPKLW